MRVYHGSTVIVRHPAILASDHTLDFGNGFYTTTNIEQAERWALKVKEKRNSDLAFISTYEFDLEQAERDLVMIQFPEPDRDWLHFVSKCRSGNAPVDLYDIVWGAVANDTVYTVLKLFDLGLYDEAETLKRLKIQKLYNQILFHTERSLKYCHFADAIKLEQ